MSATALELIEEVEANGGRITVEGEHLVIEPRASGVSLLAELRRYKPEIVALLQSQMVSDAALSTTRLNNAVSWLAKGKRVAVFPHCPKCCSYALYREHDQGTFECQTCGLQEIDEETARRMV